MNGKKVTGFKLMLKTSVVSGMTLVSRILGLVRDVVFARFFGASGETDAFFLAFKIPNFMRRLFAEGSFSLAFVPVLSEVRASGDRAALRRVLTSESSWLLHHGKKLQERFQLAAYKLTNQLLKTIDITREGGERFRILQESDTHIHIIGVDSDLFFTASENRETYRQLARARTNVTYGEIRSLHGHDAFLIETADLDRKIRAFRGRASAFRRRLAS